MPPFPTIATYVYSGWHACPERELDLGKGWSEWDLVRCAGPHFSGHRQPRTPVDGHYDDSRPELVERRVRRALDHGVDVFVHGWFWCNGRRVLDGALDRGYLGCPSGSEAPFAVMWANRMPHRVLPFKAADPEGVDPRRLVYTSPADFTEMVRVLAERYFARANYWRPDGRPYLSIFDTTLFLRQLGAAGARRAVARAREQVGDFHLAAIDPQPVWWKELAGIGFDSVTHYVHLPVWKGGSRTQEYGELIERRAAEWPEWAEATGLPYHPSVSPGWDATPRCTLFAGERPDRYPWTPVVVGESPALFERQVARAAAFSCGRHGAGAPLFVASLNEWSEGHYIEPDTHWGEAFLEALHRGKAGAPPP